jgi:gentisate 1,2-dioxygenase
MRAWDRFRNNRQQGQTGSGRGAGGSGIMMRFPGSELSSHMSIFPPGTYKKAHRHGPGRIIVIPEGDGYSVLWYEGGEKHIVPWTEATAFVPPNQWFHQHFNLGDVPARYLALHPAPQLSGYSETVRNMGDQIEYPDEDPFLRNYFEEELSKRGRKSLMPDEAYTNPDYVFAQAIPTGD